MKGTPAPPEIVALARERAQARSNRDWRVADALKGRIEAAGWTVVDEGLRFTLAPARPPDVVVGERLCHGSPDSVPARVDEPDQPGAVVVIVSRPDVPLEPALSALRHHLPAGTALLAVSPCTVPAEELVAADEVVWTARRFSSGAALRAALRRVVHEVVVVLDPLARPTGNIVGPLAAALADPSVAIAGAHGTRSDDLWHFQPARGDVTSVAADCYALRRQDALRRDPPDDRLALPESVATWWSLLLRDEGPDRAPRRAVLVDLPLETAPGTDPSHEDEGRERRRDAYRIGERFREHAWLAADEEVRGVPGEGPGDHDQDDDAEQRADAADLPNEGARSG